MKRHKKYRLKPKARRVLISSILVLIAGLLSIVLFNNGTNILNSVKNYFAAGDVPAHSKTITDNQNGTHKLSLDVTGDTDVNKKAANVNVLVILDTSSSMENNNAGTGNNPPRRSDAAEKVVYDFATDLFSYQDYNNPSNIQMSLVTFDSYATTSVQQNWTSTKDNITDKLSSTGERNSRKLGYHTGTNWEAGLRTGINDVLSRADNDPTFVIFVTDGAPYRRMNAQGNGQQTVGMYDGYDAAKDEARTAATYKTGNDPKGNVTFYGIYAYGDEGDYLDDLVYYALNGRERATVNEQTQETPNYYNASDTASLTSAISTIFEDIVTAMGVSDVKIEDGTTQNVKTSTGDIAHLLNVDPSSLEYWLNIPLTKDGNNYYFTDNNANKINVIVNGTTATFNWTDSKGNQHTATYQDASITNLKLKVKWNEKTDFYPAAPTASINASGESSSVDWDLSSLKALLNGVTYTVTFDVYPTQETYDLIADLKNNVITYDELDSELKKYIVDNEDGTYSLKTNTEATLSYDDNRDEAGAQTKPYTNPSPVGTNVDTIAVYKDWNNAIDDRSNRKVQLELLRDGKKALDITLDGTEEEPWKKSGIFIATGLAKTDASGNLIVLDAGHDYTFGELGSEAYNWELESITVHPMLIDGTLTELTLIENSTTCPTGETCYTINNKLYKVSGNSPTIKAINHRRSNLNIKKTVDGENANPNDKFEFTITVAQKDEKNHIIEDDTSTNNDDIWFSICDISIDPTCKNSNSLVMDDSLVTGAQKEIKNGNWTGYYYVSNNTEVKVNLKNNYNLRFTNLVSNTGFNVVEGDTTNYELIDIKTTSGFESEKDSKTINIDDKSISGNLGENNTLYQIEYENKNTNPETVESTITKVWDDNNNQDGIRPASITVQLLANNTPVEGKTVTLTNEKLTETLTNLPKYINGEEITYTWSEPTLPDGYDKVKSVVGSTTKITNKHTPETTKVKVTKEWDDNSNQDGFRPKTITIKVLDGTTVVDSNTQVTGSSTGRTWSFESIELPKYRNGQEINYTVEEEFTTEPEDAYETVGPTGTVKDGFTITNKHTPGKKSVQATKIWADNNNQDGKRPGSITFTLTKGGEVVSNKTCVADNSNNWSCSIEDLDEYENGSKITYGIKELDEINGYTTSQPVCTGYACSVTNELTSPEKITIEATKEWEDDDNSQEKRPKSITFTLVKDGVETDTKIVLDGEADNSGETSPWVATFANLDKNSKGQAIKYSVKEDTITNYTQISNDCENSKEKCTIKNRIDDLPKSYPVKKTWNDNDDQDGMRKTVKVTLTGTVEGSTWKYTDTKELSNPNWAYVFENIPTFHEGKLISYSVTEEAITYDSAQHATGYTTTYNNDYIVEGVKGTEVINTHTPEKTSISGTKTWKDNNNAYSTRPDSITINLLKNGTKVDSTTAPDKDGNWTYSFIDLDKYENGKLINYSLSEEPVKDYQTTTEEGNPNNFINTLSRITSITGQKSWDDNNITDYRPDSLTLVLYRNGEEYKSTSVNSTSNWSNTWKDLEEFDADGVKYEYTVDEKDEDGKLEYYTKESTGNKDNNYTVTNTMKTTKVKVTKNWIDDNNSQNTRPDHIMIHLYESGKTEPVKTATLTEENGWEYTFENLPTKSNGKDITYTVDEAVPDKYAQESIEGDMNSGFIITNKVLDSIVKTYPVKKTWTDDDNRDGIRSSITVTLTGTITGTDYSQDYTTTLSEGNWEYTFTNIPVFNDGKLISYQVKESDITYDKSLHSYGYDTTYNYNYVSNEVSGCEIINKHDSELIKISGTKTWKDFDDEDGIRPASITINLLKDGTQFDTKEVTQQEDGSWSYEFTNLYKFENGQKINYTIEESVPEGYTNEINPDESGMNVEVINYHMPKVTFNIHKDWNDLDDNDGKRPESITVRLLRNGTEIDSAIITGTEWNTSFADLDKYDSNGNQYDYTISEDPVEYYAEVPLIEYKENNNINITNTHELETVEDIIVRKVWKDNNNKNNNRPTSIHVNLLADGEKVDEATLSESNGWTFTFKGKLKYNAGKEIVYTVTEDTVKYYDTSINGYEITNTYNGPVIEITPPNTGININNTDTESDMTLIMLFMLTILGFLLRRKYN